MIATKPKRPIMRYHGGKWKLAPWILEHFPKHKIYVEPFGGAASVLLRKPRSFAEVYNDLDGEVVNLFRVARDQGARLRELLYLTPYSRSEFVTSYDPHDDPLEQARRTVLRSFMGFGSPGANGHNTGFRANSNRSGTTPAHDWANFPEAFEAIVARLQGVVIENKDAALVMGQHDGPETLHYVDPPYIHSTRSRMNRYCQKGYRHEMTDDQHRTLVEFLLTLKGAVIVSLYEHPIYDALGWQKQFKDAHADGARSRDECLYLSPNATITASLFSGGGVRRMQWLFEDLRDFLFALALAFDGEEAE